MIIEILMSHSQPQDAPTTLLSGARISPAGKVCVVLARPNLL
jgi:hypothetical protein